MLPENEKAWMAGFVDGEGCITIRRLSPGHRHSPYFVLVVTISNTQRAILQNFQKHYGGGISPNGNSNHVGWSEGYVWFCPIPSIKIFLNDILPHLRLKTLHASLLLEFMQLRRGSQGRKRLSEEDLEMRKQLWLRMHELLHAKGRPARLI